MVLFSERDGYVKPSEVIIRERITPEIQNAICSCYDRLEDMFNSNSRPYNEDPFREMEQFLWTDFLNLRQGDFQVYPGYHLVSVPFINDTTKPWYKKLDLIEMTVKYLFALSKKQNLYNNIPQFFVSQINAEFKRLNYAYRVVDKEIVEISSKEEISSIEDTLETGQKNIRFHINNALTLLSQRPNADYRNSIKESISAVEAFCREKTGESTLGESLKRLEDKGIIIPSLLKAAFEKLYAYTNQGDNGIRHALMTDDDTYTPSSAEAEYMLVACCSFINYLNKK